MNCHGNNEYTIVSYPVKYGLFSKLETRDYVFEFNLRTLQNAYDAFEAVILMSLEDYEALNDSILIAQLRYHY